MLGLLKPPVTDSALSKDHDEAHGEASQRAGHVFQRRFLGKRSFDGGGEGEIWLVSPGVKPIVGDAASFRLWTLILLNSTEDTPSNKASVELLLCILRIMYE